jgi:hypothetical protein
MRYLVWLVIFVSSIFAQNLYRSGDNVVDNYNNILWQDNQEVMTVLLSQVDARKYCKKKGWRLPTVDEYKSIVDKNNKQIYINQAFKYNMPDGYWTDDTLLRMFGYYGHYMNFKNAIVYYENKSYPKYVRCVRDR